MTEANEIEKLPGGWNMVRFKDYVYFQEGPGLTSDLFEGKKEGIPFLNIRCIHDSKILKEKLQFLDENKVNRCFKHFLLNEGDLVVSSSGTLGRCVFIKKEELPLLLNTSIIRMRPLNSYLSRFYLRYFVESQFFQKEIYRLSTGSAQSNYGPSHLKKIYLILPPLPEQHLIAEILETVDNAIEKTDRIIQKYKRIKQGLMQDLLTKGIDENGQIRSEETHRFKDSPLGRIPEEWEVVRLGEVCEVTSSKRIFFDEYTEDGIPFYRSKEIIEKSQGMHVEKVLYIPKSKYEMIENRFGAPKPGDILITAVGTLGVVYLVKLSDGKFYFKDGNLIWLRKWSDKKINKNFFIFAFPQIFNKQKDYLTIGTSQNALTIEKMKKMKVLSPPLPEQQRIASNLSQIDETIEKEQKYKEKLERIKQGLMGDLLTGKVRVNHLIEEGVEHVPQT